MRNIGIVVSGGPAPGINSVIASIVIEGSRKGVKTFGMDGGFAALHGDSGPFRELALAQITPQMDLGGSFLGTSRCNPLASEESKGLLERGCQENEIDSLVVIGGDGSAWISHQLTEAFDWLNVIHIPKTIDNDLPLPESAPTFGFETARSVGTAALKTLLLDAKTCSRWYLVTCMGRNAGFLALGIGLAAGAPLTIIPEEFDRTALTDPETVAKIVVGSIEQRVSQGRSYGVAILAEGLADVVNFSADTPKDALGRTQFAEQEVGELMLPYVRNELLSRGIELSVRHKDIGYELRCAAPVASDLEYTRFLGVGAVRLLAESERGAMVARRANDICLVYLADIFDGEKIESRAVNLESDMYSVARSFMIR